MPIKAGLQSDSARIMFELTVPASFLSGVQGNASVMGLINRSADPQCVHFARIKCRPFRSYIASVQASATSAGCHQD